MKRLTLYISLLGLALAACSGHLQVDKNDDQQGYADSQVVGSWKITAINSNLPWDWDGNGSVELNIYNTWSACQKDNLYTFSINSSGTGNNPATFRINCSLSDVGTWQIINTRYLLYTPVSVGTESEQLVSMTSVQFKTEKAITLSNGLPATITKTWTRQ
jgi:hypothetical protein